MFLMFCGVSVGFFFFFFFFFLSPKLRVLQLVFWVGMFMWSRFKDKPCLPCDVDNNKEEYVVDLITPISGGSAVWRWNWQWLLIPVLGFHQVQWWCPWLTPFFFVGILSYCLSINIRVTKPMMIWWWKVSCHRLSIVVGAVFQMIECFILKLVPGCMTIYDMVVRQVV